MRATRVLLIIPHAGADGLVQLTTLCQDANRTAFERGLHTSLCSMMQTVTHTLFKDGPRIVLSSNVLRIEPIGMCLSIAAQQGPLLIEDGRFPSFTLNCRIWFPMGNRGAFRV